MRAIEFQGRLTGQGSISIPGDIAHELPPDSPVRVILLWDNSEDSAWKSLSSDRLGNAYAAGEDVYESLLNGSTAR
jgi:hypothetical protein